MSRGRATTSGSMRRMSDSPVTDARNESASTRTGIGAVKSWTSTPATPGPASWASEPLAFILPFASTSCGRPTRPGRYAWYATTKNTLNVPTANPTT